MAQKPPLLNCPQDKVPVGPELQEPGLECLRVAMRISVLKWGPGKRRLFQPGASLQVDYRCPVSQMGTLAARLVSASRTRGHKDIRS